MNIEQISAPLTKDQAYALVDAVMERENLALTASAHENENTTQWYFEATCESPADLEAFSTLARQVLGIDATFSFTTIDPEINWVARSLSGLAPVIAGNFYVYGSHETCHAPGELTPIKIDAAQAFGTGHHETTTGCLEAIDKMLQRITPKAVIDIGTGTGVLAIALAKRLKTGVIATDIDPVAVRTTIENATENGVSQHIDVIEATGLAHPQIANHAPYDLIVANILAKPLITLAPDMGQSTAIGATVILSGILNTQARSVIAAYKAANFELADHLQRKDWTTLILEKQ